MQERFILSILPPEGSSERGALARLELSIPGSFSTAWLTENGFTVTDESGAQAPFSVQHWEDAGHRAAAFAHMDAWLAADPSAVPERPDTDAPYQMGGIGAYKAVSVYIGWPDGDARIEAARVAIRDGGFNSALQACGVMLDGDDLPILMTRGGAKAAQKAMRIEL